MDISTIHSIFHPTDFSDASRVAFEHALKLALLYKADLRIMHVAEKNNVGWADFTSVRETLERWHLLPPGSPRHAVLDLGIDVEKIVAQDDDPVKSCMLELHRSPADLIVLATHQHQGRMTWLNHAVAEPLARAATTMTLFLPHGIEGFVDTHTGEIHLNSVLIPVTITPSPTAAINTVNSLTRLIVPAASAAVTTLHVGDGEAQAKDEPNETGWRWNQINHEGQPVETILRTAYELNSGLIAMTTRGRHGFLDLLRGTTTEQVLRGAHCPVLAVPVQS